ncbi:hypothetical protein [Bradyrhizobium erythrophlei]|jgi:hypothetical protein|uniref:Holin-X, holin superfamily III n=1 Tax=Bradyrhizobium erythrophlei TaxID=1437360 RepID=A0A1M7UCC8_9BRAD|nr:hypothetical protein [Bradyrhizobium erythrophlei]SHN80605.1 hypothetical protein SAMN05444170_4438 [Bradyrhizobium erythrophlei]
MSELAKSRASAGGLVRSYGNDLRGWAGSIANRYRSAAVVVVGSSLALLIAIGFGIAAAFHFFALRFGENTAYASVGGFFAVLGVIGFISVLIILRRTNPPLPRPQRQFEEFKRSIAIPVTLRTLGRDDRLGAIAKDPVAQIIMTASAALALGWIAAASRSAKRPM